MNGTIYSITILNFNSEIGFLYKNPEFPPEISNNYTKQITNFVKTNYLDKNENNLNLYISMEYCLNKNTRTKISLIGKICVIILFSPLLDIYYINLFNDALKRSFYSIANTRKIKMENFKGPYLNINKYLSNILNFINPNNEFIFTKIENKNDLEKSQYGYFDIYFQRYAFAKENLKKTVLRLNLKPYNKVKQEGKFREDLNKVNLNVKFKLNKKIMSVFESIKKSKRNFYLSNSSSESKENISPSKDNKKDKQDPNDKNQLQNCFNNKNETKEEPENNELNVKDIINNEFKGENLLNSGIKENNNDKKEVVSNKKKKHIKISIFN